MNNRKTILPVILILSLIFTGWFAYTPKENTRTQTPVIDQLTQEISKVTQLPSGSEFTLTVTDADLTKAAEELLVTYKAEIDQAIKDYAGVGLNLSEPKVTFSGGGFELSVKVGVSFLKVNAGAAGTVTLQEGTPVITLTSVNVPVVSVPVEDANAALQTYINRYIGAVTNVYTILSINTQEGQLVINGIKK